MQEAQPHSWTMHAAAINDLFSLTPAADGPWTLATNLVANTTSVNACPDVGLALHRYVQLLTTTLVLFINQTPHARHAFATPQGPLPSGAECPYGVWLVKVEDGAIIEPTCSR
ncbi:hypothetical protein SPRG_09846 [Saprolegnia parasitica CBS 223.65]|uniref:Uncharacterized protein n=1 Tax=Saprolegnia parasitica (strain CBS 223.65) TaxID=695850 RepID=A0A067C0Y7_SAPPC|nr:hypothetical protein SPRG_09846 [Saprolegnia parasitica CBS 223.65]KDO24464.1 hypothetical protein SPRG_09846 [Saprolegnia parasitica CBS 223.65]|eukprot:XP_012204885.1 hypothetical protein SPRG_09846 [Saprolegnia parasitica CBS 223.65]